MAKRLAIMIIIVMISLLSIMGSASADWSGDAQVKTTTVVINSMEHLTVVVHNDGPAPIDVLSVALTINWHGMPTLYRVFEGHAIIQPGESREFVSAPTRMPNVALGTYDCFAGVVASGPDGVAVEQRYPGTITASQLSLAPAGVPEEVFFPLMLTAGSLLVTVALFKLERSKHWPYLRTQPRWMDHQ